MRIADPAELNPEKPLESVLTAAIPSFVVESLVNALRDVDQYDAPGPSKMAVLALNAGPMVAVVYHELKNIIEILAPLDQAESALAEVVEVLRIPRTSIEWVHDSISTARLFNDANAALRHVVLVDSNLLVQGLVRDVLQAQGYQVHLAASWAAFGELLQEMTPDVALIATDLPDIHDDDVVSLVTALLKGIPHVIFSSVPVAYDHQLVGHTRIATPVSQEDLLDMVNKAFTH